jgi:hypothetical protein
VKTVTATNYGGSVSCKVLVDGVEVGDFELATDASRQALCDALEIGGDSYAFEGTSSLIIDPAGDVLIHRLPEPGAGTMFWLMVSAVVALFAWIVS